MTSKNKGIVKKECDPLIKTLVFKEQKYRLMENRLDRVHISPDFYLIQQLSARLFLQSLIQPVEEGTLPQDAVLGFSTQCFFFFVAILQFVY